MTPTYIDSINTAGVTYGQGAGENPDLEFRNMAAVIPKDQDMYNDSSSFIGAHELGHQLSIKDRLGDPGFVMCGSIDCPIGRKVSGAYSSAYDTTPRPAGSDCFLARRGGAEAKIVWETY